MSVKIEARLNRNISRSPYNVKRVYKKGTVIDSFSEKQFSKLTNENIGKVTSLCICVGHGVYEYFDLEKDIEFVRVETITIKKEKTVKIKCVKA